MRRLSWCLEKQKSYGAALHWYKKVYEKVLSSFGLSSDDVSAAKVEIARLEELLLLEKGTDKGSTKIANGATAFKRIRRWWSRL